MYSYNEARASNLTVQCLHSFIQIKLWRHQVGNKASTVANTNRSGMHQRPGLLLRQPPT